MITLYRLLALALFLFIWWAASFAVGPNLVPTPLSTASAALELMRDGKISEPLLSSLTIYFTGYLLAVIVGIPIGMLMGGIRDLGRTLDIYVSALMATPRVAFIPLIILFLGLGPEAKIAVVFLGAVIPILIGTYSGILNSDAELIEMARSMGATRSQIYWRIMLPGALGFVVMGLRIGATIGLINTVVAELYTAASGLGGLLALYGNTFQMARYFVVVLALALIGGLVSQGLRALEAWSGRWRVTAGN
ncbi:MULTISPECIES: ABC transporter permease [Chelativorans]|jgi:NitT/TauT family transport system permease protein|uniref:Binding-protein-dependent transport systems inner membrane component n=1 Tax=Chelativorans sp. (strain BNC1) TaxID=266779 RepID=Q11GK4_CHESB|nr:MULTISPECIES: ABC transporter permease [Chelativorans]